MAPTSTENGGAAHQLDVIDEHNQHKDAEENRHHRAEKAHSEIADERA
jgi:hypothetical protein